MNIEAGFLCEWCQKPLEDRPPVDEDFRTPPGEKRRLCGECLEEIKATALLKHFDAGLDMIAKAFEPKREIKVLHVVGPLDGPICPECGEEGEKQTGSWDYGPLHWWACENRHQWGHA